MKSYRAVVMAFVLGAFLSALVIGTMLPYSQAQNQPAAAGQLHFFTYSSNVTGIYDGSSNMLFLYDQNLDKCTCVRQITQLGDPMKKIKN